MAKGLDVALSCDYLYSAFMFIPGLYFRILLHNGFLIL